MKAFAALLTVGLLAGAPATAGAAAAPWSTPSSIAGAPDAPPSLAQDAGGPIAVYWETLQLSQPFTSANINTFVSPLGPGLQPGPAALVSPPLNTGAAVGLGHGNVALKEQAGIATGPIAGPFVDHPLPGQVAAIAADASGDIAGVLDNCTPTGCGPAAPAVVIARHGHAFGRPIPVDRKGTGYGTSVAIDQHGRILVAWDRNGGIYARFVSIRGKLGPIRRLAKETAQSHFDVVLSADGRAAVGWTSQTIDEGDALSPFTATLALAGSNGHFGRAHRLGTVAVTGTGNYVPYQGLVVELPAGRAGLAAWTGYDGTNFVVDAAPITNGRVGSRQTVSAHGIDTLLATAAEGADGAAVILLLPGRAGEDPAGTGQADGLVAVTHAAGTQTFGAPEQILPGPAYVDGASVGIDAASGAVFATWRSVGSPIGWSDRTPLG